MSKFKVGDRVAAYMTDLDVSEDPYRMVGTIISISDKGIIKLKADPDEITEAWGFEEWQVHPKQCRKLKKQERRRVWLQKSHADAVPFSAGVSPFQAWARVPNDSDEWVEFVEVRKKK